MEYKNKWNKYKIGKVPWIESRKNHFSKELYVNYMANNSAKTVLEIGAGEAHEAQLITRKRPDIDYQIMDVSETFLKHAKLKGFKTHVGDMIDTGFGTNSFDMVYCCSVLEHSPNIKKTIKELARISKSFYFTMFKWRMKTGTLKAKYREAKKYYSSEFNLTQLIALINKYGIIHDAVICTSNEHKGKNLISWSEYEQKLVVDGIDFHRNGNYLSILGEWS